MSSFTKRNMAPVWKDWKKNSLKLNLNKIKPDMKSLKAFKIFSFQSLLSCSFIAVSEETVFVFATI